ncbi:unnamed protein product [Bemisia tabaci]|uniref:E3 ubiquitin-protein ligase n=1 Tax=Bemisia tabaci TaxID=7038 RepID=A0A9P0AIB4_BEMTA|nr:unnamed protein product [Bemisia tabaci]
MPKLTGKELKRYYAEIRELMKCPVCYDLVSPPVKVCRYGHAVCNSCLHSVTECPLCKSLFSAGKQTLLDNFLTAFPYPCPFSEDGCDQVHPLTSHRKHVRDCDFRKSRCAEFRCRWTGRSSELLPHFRVRHPRKLWIGEQFTIRFRNFVLGHVMNEVRAISAFGRSFFFRFRNYPHERCCIAAVQTFGAPASAENFDYSLEFFSADKKFSVVFCSRTHPDDEMVFARSNSSFSLMHGALKSFIVDGVLSGKLSIQRRKSKNINRADRGTV